MAKCMAGDLLKETFPEAVRDIEEFRRETSITVDAGKIREVMTFLKENEKLCYDLLLDLAGVDFDDRSPRFMIAYLLHSTENQQQTPDQNDGCGRRFPGYGQ